MNWKCISDRSSEGDKSFCFSSATGHSFWNMRWWNVETGFLQGGQVSMKNILKYWRHWSDDKKKWLR